MNLENHKSRWTEQELDFLLSQWDHTQATCEVIAEILERTPAAVSQRYYEETWGTAAAPAKSKDVPALIRRTTTSTTTTTEWVGEVCAVCWEVRSVNGSCGCS